MGLENRTSGMRNGIPCSLLYSVLPHYGLFDTCETRKSVEEYPKSNVEIQGHIKPPKAGCVKESQLVPSSLKRSRQLLNSGCFSQDLHS